MWRFGALRFAPAATLLLFAAQGALIPELHGDMRHESMDAATGQHFALAGHPPGSVYRSWSRRTVASKFRCPQAFPAGWSRVVLLRRDAAGVVVVADAVRVRQQ